MVTLRRFCAVAIVAALAANGFAQTSSPTTKPMPAASDVLGQVPSNALAVLVVKDVRQTTNKIDKFLADAGLAPLLRQQMPKGALDTLITATMMGQGFNPDGGFAVAMMDPSAYGIDLIEMMSPASAPASEPATATAEKKLPFVIYVPGNDVESVFANYKISKAGKYPQVALRMGSVYATTSGGYVAISPIEKVLEDAVAAPRKLASDITGQQAEVMKDSAFSIYVNLKLGSPLVSKLMENVQKQMQKGSPMGAMPIMGVYKDLLAQLQTVVVSGKIESTGIVFDVLVAADPNSAYGKVMAQYQGTSGTYVDRLPNLPYFVAAGMQIHETKDSADVTAKSIDQMLAMDALKGLSEETRTHVKKLVVDMQGQVTSMQIAFGGAPEGVSGFAGAGVFECKDSAAFKGLMAQAAEVVQEVVHGLAGDNADLKSLAVTYTKDAEKSDSLSVDVIEISGPNIEKNAEDITKALGEDKLRLRVVALDKGLAVVTFGGGEAMVSAAVKSARGGGSIPSEPGTVEAMKYMPASRVCVELFNFANLFDIVKKMDESGGMPFSLQSKTPIAVGVGMSGSNERISVYIPTSLVKDVAGIVAMMSGMSPAPAAEGGAPATKPSDF